MIVYSNIEDININDKTAVAMGYFDGMHIGHQALLKKSVLEASHAGLKSVVFTFKENPRNVLINGESIKNILSSEDKARYIEEQGIDYLISVPFDSKIKNLTPEQYVLLLLSEKINMTAAYCGFNYRFGRDAAGDVTFLQTMGAAEGFDVSILEPCLSDGRIVSSSLIRNLISAGDMETSRAFLGRNYSTSGEVVSGNRLGRVIGFPTVNILIDEDMLTPAHGVYITECGIGARRYSGVTNVGVKPTVGDEKKSIETHLFDTDEDLYGKRITVEFIKMIREERRFENLDALAAQIGKDCGIARIYHSSLNR